jgi:hypothetical protein
LDATAPLTSELSVQPHNTHTRWSDISISPIPGEGKGRQLTLKGDGLADRIDLLGLGLDDVDLALLVSGDESGRLDDGSSLERTDGDGGKERSVEEVVVRGDDRLSQIHTRSKRQLALLCLLG